MLNNFKEDLKRVRAFVFDLDGVLSSQQMFMDASGILLRTVNVKDGYALRLAAVKGYPVAVISGGVSMAVRRRMRRLGIRDVYMNAKNKQIPFQEFVNRYKLEESDILYMGDDLPDLPVMKRVGFPTCPADAVAEVKQVSRYISHFDGGDGCVRDVIEQVLRLHQHWTDGDSFQW
jgi:3-deoxy-D-manno-octulosonate 8-phosphate phosphatase (KDO 8-P phosphatase)